MPNISILMWSLFLTKCWWHIFDVIFSKIRNYYFYHSCFVWLFIHLFIYFFIHLFINLFINLLYSHICYTAHMWYLFFTKSCQWNMFWIYFYQRQSYLAWPCIVIKNLTLVQFIHTYFIPYSDFRSYQCRTYWKVHTLNFDLDINLLSLNFKLFDIFWSNLFTIIGNILVWLPFTLW